jgi:hypothetical protein
MDITNKYPLFFFLAFVFFSCQRAPVEIDSEPPVFKMEGLLEGEPFKLTAGDQGTYMFTGTHTDTLGVVEHIGLLGDFGCDGDPECPGALTFVIRGMNVSGLTEIENTLIPGDHSFREPSVPAIEGYRFFFKGTPELKTNDYSVHWDFGDGQTASGLNVEHIYDADVVSAIVCQTVINNINGDSSSLCMEVRPGSECLVTFTYDPNDLRVEHFIAHTNGANPVNILWNFGWGFHPRQYYIDNHYYFNQQLPYQQVSVKTIDANGCTAKYAQNVSISGDKHTVMANFSYSSSAVVSLDNTDFQDVTIVYTTTEGNTYYSNLGFQPDFGSLTIYDISGFSLNSSGQHTKKFNVDFSCRLFLPGVTGEYIDITEATGVLAVGY